MPRQNLFAIKHPKGTFYSHCDIVGTKKVIESDPSGKDVVQNRHILEPVFSTDGVSKFDTAADATEMMAHAFLQDPAAFSGCIVEPYDA